MGGRITDVVQALRFGIALLGIVALLVGSLSVVAPRRSIALYQWIMARFNWRVSPIDEAREIRNTRLLGAVLALLGVMLWWCVGSQRADILAFS
ncbi:MAG: hypothetical protein HYY90_04835 [Candidatus Omnitrophica bacterium]|nr:hypothetical protein [Candidatus Omnitrophota bacterium]MBI3020679.1 hypothetical protein [Candidatus Omnitrophota bacterium]MBI3083670.1 hypothetical protein [Candidatus Omnitrophota bacterium]